MIPGPAGLLECAVDAPAAGSALGTAVVCHPHPQFGGTLDNKVVQTLARAFVQLGWRSVRFNFRGVGASQGAWDEGIGEIDDALAVIAAFGGAASGAAQDTAAAAAGAVIPSAADRAAPIAAPKAAGAPSTLLLAGFSFGAFVAAEAAVRLPDAAKPRRMVLVGPSTQRHRMQNVPADTVVIHGESDEVVPIAATFAWARPQSLPVIVFPGVGHFFHGQLPLLKNVVVQALLPNVPS